MNKNNTSGYKGVCWVESNQKYRASIGVNYETILLGHFNVKEDAARAYNEAALKYFGENAWLNKLP
jgi:hypothetical protein